MVLLLEIFATLAAGLFSRASIYINLVEHSARMQCETTGRPRAIRSELQTGDRHAG